MIGPGLGLGLVLALAAQGEHAVLDLHVQIARLEPRHIGAKLDSVCRFDHVYGGRPAPRWWSGGPQEITEQLIYFVFQTSGAGVFRVPQVPTHGSSSPFA